MQSYHNTTDEPIQLAIDFERKAKQQEELVMIYFNGHRMGSPCWVHTFLIGMGRISITTPLTSIRRAITNLTKQGKLRKTHIKVEGIYGRQEYCWEKV